LEWSSRNYSRFKWCKQVNTGIDPLGSWDEFIRRDKSKNIDLYYGPEKLIVDIDSCKDCPAIGTTVRMSNSEVSSIKNTLLGGDSVVKLKTDHISFSLLANERKFQKVYDQTSLLW